MALSALLLSRDTLLIATLRRLLEDIAVRVEVCASTSIVKEMLRRQKFEALLLDIDDVDGARNLLTEVRATPLNKNSILFAITHRHTNFRAAFDQGANFVFEKPIAIERAVRSLRAAHPLMLRERRRTFRHAIDTAVFIKLSGGREVRARGVDLSEGGAAIHLPAPPPLGTDVQFRFQVPESDLSLEGRGVIAWVTDDRVGLQFTSLRKELQLDLANWLSAQLELESAAPAPLPPAPAARNGHGRTPKFAVL
jgi:CheY-like chemotaxis protein